METADFFRARIDAMINLSDPPAVLATRLAGNHIEAAVAAKFERQNRAGQILEGQDLFGPTQVLKGTGSSNAGRTKLSIRLMARLLYLKHSFNPSDEEVAARAEARTCCVSFLAAWTTTNTGCHATPRKSAAFGATWAKKVWSTCSRPPPTRPRGYQGGQAQRPGARDRRHHGPGEGHRAPGGQSLGCRSRATKWSALPSALASSSSRHWPRKANSCVGALVATRMPGSSDA